MLEHEAGRAEELDEARRCTHGYIQDLRRQSVIVRRCTAGLCCAAQHIPRARAHLRIAAILCEF